MNAKQNLSRTISVTIEKNNYTVKYPTIGQLMKIEAMKMLYSTNTYGSLVRARTKSAERALDIIDMMSHFSILMPTLNDDLIGVSSIEDLDQEVAQKLIKVYLAEVKPWLEKWDALLTSPVEKKKEEDVETE